MCFDGYAVTPISMGRRLAPVCFTHTHGASLLSPPTSAAFAICPRRSHPPAFSFQSTPRSTTLTSSAKEDSPAPDSKPSPAAQSLADRLGDLATGDNSDKNSAPSNERPTVNKANPLLGKALAGANAERSSPSKSAEGKEDASKESMSAQQDDGRVAWVCES